MKRNTLTNKKGVVTIEFIIVSGIVVVMVGLTVAAWARQSADINNQVHYSINLAQKEYASIQKP